MSNQPVIQPAKKRNLRELLQSDAVKEQLALVLPKHMTPDRMARVALTAILKTPKLGDCTPESLLQSLMICSQAGLEPDGRNAHLIPYGDQVQVIFDYKGLVALAERNGVECIYADKVCDNDIFDAGVENGEKKLSHKIDWKKSRGTPYAYYGSCRRNNRLDYEVMTREEVDAIRKRSRAGNNGPWMTDYDEMAKKTVLRRMSKRWDLSAEVIEAIAADFDAPDFNKAQVVKPSFAASVMDADDIPYTYPVGQGAPAAQKPPEEKPEPEKPNQLPELLKLMAKDAIDEPAVLAYLREIKAVDESLSSLAEISLVSPSVIEGSVIGWKVAKTKIKGGKS